MDKGDQPRKRQTHRTHKPRAQGPERKSFGKRKPSPQGRSESPGPQGSRAPRPPAPKSDRDKKAGPPRSGPPRSGPPRPATRGPRPDGPARADRPQPGGKPYRGARPQADGRPRPGGERPNRPTRRPRRSDASGPSRPDPRGRPSPPRASRPSGGGREKPVEDSPLSRDWVKELRDVARVGGADAAIAFAGRALEAFSQDDFAAAIQDAEKAKAEASRSPKIRELLGLSYYGAGRWQEAARELLTFRRLTGSFEDHHVIADCYRALGRPDRALEICGEVPAGALPPELQTEVDIVAASALADKNDLKQALAKVDRPDPKEVEPHHLRLWYVRADLLERNGRRDEAREVWERIYAEDPGFFDVADRLRGR